MLVTSLCRRLYHPALPLSRYISSPSAVAKSSANPQTTSSAHGPHRNLGAATSRLGLTIDSNFRYNDGTLDLVHLLEQGDFESARALKELVYADYPLQRHRKFLEAVRQAFTIPDREVKMKAIIDWWKLVPREDRFSALPELITTVAEPPIDLDLVIRFTLSSVELGHDQIVIARLLARIIRFANVRDSFSALTTIETILKARHTVDPERWSKARNQAIRTNISISRFDVALGLRASAPEGFVIDSESQRTLIAAAPGSTSLANYQEIPDTSWARFGVLSSHKFTASQTASHLRTLRRIIRLPDPPRFKSFLADFMYSYKLMHQRSRALDILRKRVFVDNPRPAVRDRWVLGELQFYSSQKQYVSALRLFAHHYVVPRALAAPIGRVLAREWEIAKKARAWEMAKDGAVELTAVEKLLRHNERWHWWTELQSSLLPIPERLSPGNKGLLVAWRAVIDSTRDIDELEDLYRTLRSEFKAKKDNYVALSPLLNKEPPALRSSSAGSISAEDVNTLMDVSSVVGSDFDACNYFQPFILVFGYLVGPRRALSVLSDMLASGFPISLDSWSTVASSFAHAGDTAGTDTLLRHIETTFGPGTGNRVNEPSRRHKMLRSYCHIMKGYTRSGQYAAAREVLARMEKNADFSAAEIQRAKLALRSMGPTGREDEYRRNLDMWLRD